MVHNFDPSAHHTPNNPDPQPPAGIRSRLVLLGDRATVRAIGDLRGHLAPGQVIVASFSFDVGAAFTAAPVTELPVVVDAIRAASELAADLWVPWPSEDFGVPVRIVQLHTAAAIAGVALRCGVPVGAFDLADSETFATDVAAMAAAVLAASASTTLAAEAAAALRLSPASQEASSDTPLSVSRRELGVRLAIKQLAAAGLGVDDIARVLRRVGAVKVHGPWTPRAVLDVLAGTGDAPGIG